MLKLERIYKSREINIRLRKKERFLNRIFWQAFLIALAIHLVGFVIFKVQVFLSSSAGRIAPVMAQADLEKEIFNLQLSDEHVPRNYPLEPPKSRPELPSQNRLSVDKPVPFAQEDHFNHDAFLTELEAEFFPPLDVALNVEYYPAFEVILMGMLAERNMSHKKLEFPDAVPFPFEEGLSSVYSIRVNEENGEIFWIELSRSSGIKELDKMGEKILKGIRMTHDPSLFVTAGEVQINFSNKIKR